MSDDMERRAIERRRQEAARIIAANEKRRRARITNELLLDQDALSRAAAEAGLEEPEDRS